jgi:hypothetical protein
MGRRSRSGASGLFRPSPDQPSKKELRSVFGIAADAPVKSITRVKDS